jgi:TRAP-type mannitol/chloroaromatic compound transport system permease large subunit
MRRELWFALVVMALILIPTILFTPWTDLKTGHLGLLMLALVVVAIMLGFPTAFTLMGMGVFFAWLAYRNQNPELAATQVLDLMVQRTYGVMANDVLIAVPLFVFMGYLVERANLIEKLFRSLHLALARVPGSLAVATLVTCAVFATATGIVGAVVTLMGLLAFPAMLKAGYNVKLAAGSITAGGCLGILIPPSVLLILYGATAGVSVVQLYAGAFFPGLMLTALYIGFVVLVANLNPSFAPPLPERERRVPLPPFAQALAPRRSNALTGLFGALGGTVNGVSGRTALAQLLVALIPFVVLAAIMGYSYYKLTAPAVVVSTEGLQEMGSGGLSDAPASDRGDLQEPQAEGVQEPPSEESGALKEPPSGELKEPAAAPGVPGTSVAPPADGTGQTAGGSSAAPSAPAERQAVPPAYWIVLAIVVLLLTLLYGTMSWERLEVFKMLLTSFFPLAVLILAVLGTIVFGLATPTEAAAVGGLGGALLAIAYRYVENRGRKPAGAIGASLREMGPILKESTFLTAKTSAMVCWLFVGSSIFSAAFALLGGQEIIERWVLSLGLTPLQFTILAQLIIFILGWPLEWTEIIVIFMPIFIPLLAKFNVDPLFFGLLVALNLQTAFLSPPVAMAAFYLKGVAPPHVTLNQIFAGMMPFMGIQVVALALLYIFPQIGLWLPQVLYR